MRPSEGGSRGTVRCSAHRSTLHSTSHRPQRAVPVRFHWGTTGLWAVSGTELQKRVKISSLSYSCSSQTSCFHKVGLGQSGPVSQDDKLTLRIMTNSTSSPSLLNNHTIPFVSSSSRASELDRIEEVEESVDEQLALSAVSHIASPGSRVADAAPQAFRSPTATDTQDSHQQPHSVHTTVSAAEPVPPAVAENSFTNVHDQVTLSASAQEGQTKRQLFAAVTRIAFIYCESIEDARRHSRNVTHFLQATNDHDAQSEAFCRMWCMAKLFVQTPAEHDRLNRLADAWRNMLQ